MKSSYTYFSFLFYVRAMRCLYTSGQELSEIHLVGFVFSPGSVLGPASSNLHSC